MKDQLETSVTEIDELCFKLFLKEQFDIYSFVCWLDGGLAQIKTGNRGEQLAWLCLKVRKIQLFLVFMRIFLVHRASVLKNDFRKLQGDIILQLNQPRSEGVNGRMAKMSKTREVCH